MIYIYIYVYIYNIYIYIIYIYIYFRNQYNSITGADSNDNIDSNISSNKSNCQFVLNDVLSHGNSVQNLDLAHDNGSISQIYWCSDSKGKFKKSCLADKVLNLKQFCTRRNNILRLSFYQKLNKRINCQKSNFRNSSKHGHSQILCKQFTS